MVRVYCVVTNEDICRTHTIQQQAVPETKPKLLNLYKAAVLSELTLPQHIHGQPIQEPTSGC